MTDETVDNPPEKLVGALVNALKVLRYVNMIGEPVRVSQVARSLDLNVSTSYHLLRTLVHEGVLLFDPTGKTYRIGPGLLELAHGALGQLRDPKIIRTHLEEVAANYDVTATLWHRSGEDRVVLTDFAETDSAIRVHMDIGQRLPLLTGALGRCFAAQSDLTKQKQRQLYNEVRWDKAPTYAQYCDQILEARQRGYAIDRGNFGKSVTTIAAVATDREGYPTMAISIIGFSAQFDAPSARRMGEDIRDRAKSISQSHPDLARKAITSSQGR